MEYKTALRCAKYMGAFEQSVIVPDGFDEQQWNALKSKLMLKDHFCKRCK